MKKLERVSRKDYYDYLRIILVILVVVGHGSYYDIGTLFGGIHYGNLMDKALLSDTFFHRATNCLTNFIYTFHMPVFIALSGSLFALGKNMNVKEFTAKKAKRLLIPFFTVWLLWNFPIKFYTGYYNNVSTTKILLQMIFPSCVYLWYLECLFFVFILAYYICKLDKRKQMIVVALCWFIGIIVYKKFAQYHFLGDPLYYILWFWLGYQIENIISWMKKQKVWRDSIIVCMLIIVCIVVFIFKNFENLKIFNLIFLNIVDPFFMLIVLNYLVRRLDKENKKLEKISGYGMGIYLYAEPLNYYFLYLFYKYFGIVFFGSEIGAAVIYFSRIIITPIIAIFITWGLKKLHLKYLY